ncbi:hypothetical protein [Vulcanisaeta moutnovskia]|nr:hypothetical protein [Vulcanisaeta moutnovskia]
MPGRALIAGIIVAVVAVALIAMFIIPHYAGPPIRYLTINAPYVFMKPIGNGQYDVGYYNSQGQWVDLGIYNVSSNALQNAVNVINSFNQQNMGTTLPQPYGTQFQPLDYVVVVGNSTGIVQIPVQGNTILLNKVNPGDWTVLVTDPNDVNKLMYALDTGYKEAAGVMSLSQVYTSKYPGSIIYETGMLYHYNNEFAGGVVIVMNNNTLIPWGYMWHISSQGFGGFLPFVIQASANRYS